MPHPKTFGVNKGELYHDIYIPCSIHVPYHSVCTLYTGEHVLIKRGIFLLETTMPCEIWTVSWPQVLSFTTPSFQHTITHFCLTDQKDILGKTLRLSYVVFAHVRRFSSTGGELSMQ